MSVVEPRTVGTVELPGGRQYCWATYGNEEGHPCFFLHGSPGSRLQPRWVFDDPAALDSLCLIAPDRPGYGRSDPGFDGFKGSGGELSFLAEHLGIDRFTILGVSGGAGYALAATAQLGGRVEQTVILGGMSEYERSDLAGMSRLHRFFFGPGRRTPGLMAVGLRRQVKAMTKKLRGPHAVDALVKSAPEADREETEARATPEMAAAVADDLEAAMSQGQAAVLADFNAYADGFDFDLSAVTSPVRWWHGRQDTNVPIAIARRTAAACPRIALTEFDGGHRPTAAIRWNALAAAAHPPLR